MTVPAVAVSRAPAGALYALGGLLLAVETAVHIQQFVETFHDVRWIGPLFLANAAACAAATAGLFYGRTRRLAAVGGIAISALALGALVLSYAVGVRLDGGPASERPSSRPSRPRSGP